VLFLGTWVFLHGNILGKVAFVLPFALGTVLTGFEIFVAGMQAFIITILTAVYIAGAAHPEH
jgi:F-type H+-transporting ATPase subunit a